jgi:hypothetical protein
MLLWHSDNMKALSSAICEGSGKEHLLSHVDEPDRRGVCGFCKRTLVLEVLNGIMILPKHFKPAKPKRPKKSIAPSKKRAKSTRRGASRDRGRFL